MIHATCIAVGGRGVLIEGPSGSGKSDLALRLIDRGAALVGDDQVVLARRGALLYAGVPATIAGKLEVRGVGVVGLPHVTDVPVALLVRLGAPDRLPDTRTRLIDGVRLPELVVSALEPSAPLKVELALGAIPA